jgi:hypothetical protein
MKRLALGAVAAVTLAIVLAAPALPENSKKQSTPPPQRCLYPAFEKFSARVWAVDRWQRGDPPQKTIQAAHKRIGCAPVGHRKAMKKRWREDRAAYYQHRSSKLWVARVKPFVYPDGTRWAVPYPIAWCESGGNYFVGPSGAYGLIPPFPQWLSPREQDEIAHRLYLEMGEGPWAPYEGGCAYR